MKKRMSVLIEEDVIRQAKRLAFKEDRPLNTVIQDALVSYLGRKVPDPRTREEAYQLFCERPMLLSRQQFNDILKEDSFKRD